MRALAAALLCVLLCARGACGAAPPGPPAAVQPGCTLGPTRLVGRSLGALVALVSEPLQCCSRCASAFPAAEAYFVCINRAGCSEPGEPFRAFGACECQAQNKFKRGQQVANATTCARCYAGGVIVTDLTPFTTVEGRASEEVALASPPPPPPRASMMMRAAPPVNPPPPQNRTQAPPPPRKAQAPQGATAQGARAPPPPRN